VPGELRNKLGIAMALRTYQAKFELLASPRWHRIYSDGARPIRLLWASTGVKDPQASPLLYVKALAAPCTVDTMPEGTLKALAQHTVFQCSLMRANGGDCEEVLAAFSAAGIDIDALAERLQEEGTKSFVNSWNSLMTVIASKREPGSKAA
jgi:transaldolase